MNAHEAVHRLGQATQGFAGRANDCFAVVGDGVKHVQLSSASCREHRCKHTCASGEDHQNDDRADRDHE